MSEEIVELEIKLRHHTTKKTVFGKTVEKSFGCDFVEMKGDDGVWRHVGWYVHAANMFSGLVNWDNSLNESMAKAIEKKTGKPCRYSGAPQDEQEPEQTEEDYEDEFE